MTIARTRDSDSSAALASCCQTTFPPFQHSRITRSRSAIASGRSTPRALLAWLAAYLTSPRVVFTMDRVRQPHDTLEVSGNPGLGWREMSETPIPNEPNPWVYWDVEVVIETGGFLAGKRVHIEIETEARLRA